MLDRKKTKIKFGNLLLPKISNHVERSISLSQKPFAYTVCLE